MNKKSRKKLRKSYQSRNSKKELLRSLIVDEIVIDCKKVIKLIEEIFTFDERQKIDLLEVFETPSGDVGIWKNEDYYYLHFNDFKGEEEDYYNIILSY